MNTHNKYELVPEDTVEVCGLKLFRIRALQSFGNVTSGQRGGYIESEHNLSHTGDAWVYDNARVSGGARVSGNAWVYGNAQVHDNAWVSGGARVYGNAQVSGNARVSGDARVYGNASIFWAEHVGSEQGTLTVFRAEAGLMVTRGCFIGSDAEFLAAVDARHGEDSKIGREYHLLIEVARSRIDTSVQIPEVAIGRDLQSESSMGTSEAQT